MQSLKLIKLERYESSILDLLNQFLKTDVYNDLLKKATFTYCKMTKDYSLVKVYVDTFNRDELDKIVFNLNKFKGLFRSEIARNYNFHKAPQVEFFRDNTIDRANEIETILKDLKGK
ncbi:MAG: 30S ribosome-binding factor RbfA [Mycoplasmoidaceae bacterium]